MLTGGKWGDGWACPVCGGSNSGARLKCRSCEYKKAEEIDTSQECVEKTAESIHDCGGAQRHRYAGRFGE